MAELTDKLINFAFLKQEVDIPQGLDNDEFDHKIHRAQQRLRMLMGDEFYQDFLTNYKNNTLSAAYQSLYKPYIKQFVAFQTYELWTVTANFKPTRSGFRIHSEENSEAVSSEGMAIIIKDAKQEAEYYAKLLVDFIKNHSSDYPLYNNGCKSLIGNSFHISAVKNKHDNHCNCRKCRY
jgi:hypothetical protein